MLDYTILRYTTLHYSSVYRGSNRHDGDALDAIGSILLSGDILVSIQDSTLVAAQHHAGPIILLQVAVSAASDLTGIPAVHHFKCKFWNTLLRVITIPITIIASIRYALMLGTRTAS